MVLDLSLKNAKKLVGWKSFWKLEFTWVPRCLNGRVVSMQPFTPQNWAVLCNSNYLIFLPIWCCCWRLMLYVFWCEGMLTIFRIFDISDYHFPNSNCIRNCSRFYLPWFIRCTCPSCVAIQNIYSDIQKCEHGLYFEIHMSMLLQMINFWINI